MENKIEHNGKLYAVGGSYLDNQCDTVILAGKRENGEARCNMLGRDGFIDYLSFDVPFAELKVSPHLTGTITDAPKEVELEDGEWYLCNSVDSSGLSVHTSLFYLEGEWYRYVVADGACGGCPEDVTVIHKLSKQTAKPISREEFADLLRDYVLIGDDAVNAMFAVLEASRNIIDKE